MAIERRFSIMHVILEPRYSGAETLVRDLVQIQSGQGHRTSIVAFRPAQADFAPEMKALQERGSELYIPPRSLEKFRRLKWVFAAIRDARPDIVFAHSMLPSLYARLAFLLTRRAPIVTVLHTDDDLSNPVLFRMERLLWKWHACVVGVSPKSIENYLLRTGHAVPTRVIRNGIQTDHFVEVGRNHRAWRETIYKAAGDEIIALQVGRIAIQKQQHVSVEALIRLQANGVRNVRLVLAGVFEEPEYRERVLRCAQDGGVADRVQFVGPQGNIGEMLAGADVFLMPSAWEAHSVAALEALASGVFCVFSGIAAFADLKTYSGVAMIGNPPTGEELGACLEDLVKTKAWEYRYERDLKGSSISRCAAEYMRLTEEYGRRDSR